MGGSSPLMTRVEFLAVARPSVLIERPKSAGSDTSSSVRIVFLRRRRGKPLDTKRWGGGAWTGRGWTATVLLMPAIARIRAVVVDCPDPRALAEFYRSLVGGEIMYADDYWVYLRDGGNVLLSFQRAADYQAPVWPSAEHGQQFHIDVTVDDVDRAEQQILSLGARRTELQPGIEESSNWRVYLDPVGHPFCLRWD